MKKYCVTLEAWNDASGWSETDRHEVIGYKKAMEEVKESRGMAGDDWGVITDDEAEKLKEKLDKA